MHVLYSGWDTTRHALLHVRHYAPHMPKRPLPLHPPAAARRQGHPCVLVPPSSPCSSECPFTDHPSPFANAAAACLVALAPPPDAHTCPQRLPRPSTASSDAHNTLLPSGQPPTLSHLLCVTSNENRKTPNPPPSTVAKATPVLFCLPLPPCSSRMLAAIHRPFCIHCSCLSGSTGPRLPAPCQVLTCQQCHPLLAKLCFHGAGAVQRWLAVHRNQTDGDLMLAQSRQGPCAAAADQTVVLVQPLHPRYMLSASSKAHGRWHQGNALVTPTYALPPVQHIAVYDMVAADKMSLVWHT